MTEISHDVPRILAEHRKWLRGEGGSRADLSRADLSGANLSGAKHLIDSGQRLDGYRFVGWVKDGTLMIRAGCRNMTLAEYRTHNAARSDVALRDETTAILDHIEAVARVRELLS